MTENNAIYEGGGLKGPLYWLAGVATGKLALNAFQGGGGGWGFGNNMATMATQAAGTAMSIELARKDSEIALLKANADTDKKLVEVYSNLRVQNKEQDAKLAQLQQEIHALDKRIGESALIASNGITHLNDVVMGMHATLASITRTAVPNTAICPGWGQVTVSPSGPTVVPTPAVAA